MKPDGLAVRVPDSGDAVSRVKKHRSLPIYCRPLQVKIPGAAVALVKGGGKVALLGKAIKLIGPTRVRLVTGKYSDRGYLMNLSGITSPKDAKLHMLWRALGQMRYFDRKNWVSVITGELKPANGKYLPDFAVAASRSLVRRLAFSGGIFGKPKNDPESQLVKSYVSWLRAEEEFEQHYLVKERHHTDLFDLSRWRLIEAKVNCDRFTLRLALGQLFDYKRSYLRRPSLGVLLASRPSPSCIEFLAHFGVTTIWRTSNGSFRDSSAERSWTLLRRHPS